MQQHLAPQDNLIVSGFLNSFKWNGQNQKAAWIYLAIGEKDMEGNRVYNSILCQVYGNVARMLAAKQAERESAKAAGQRMSVLVQITSGMVTSFTPQDQQGQPTGTPVTYVKGFKASIVNTQDRSILDHSDNPAYAEQSQGYAPAPPAYHAPAPAQNAPAPQQPMHQGHAPAQNAPAPQQPMHQGHAPAQNAPAPQQPMNQGHAPAQNAPAPQQPMNPSGHVEDDFDDDIPF